MAGFINFLVNGCVPAEWPEPRSELVWVFSRCPGLTHPLHLHRTASALRYLWRNRQESDAEDMNSCSSGGPVQTVCQIHFNTPAALKWPRLVRREPTHTEPGQRLEIAILSANIVILLLTYLTLNSKLLWVRLFWSLTKVHALYLKGNSCLGDMMAVLSVQIHFGLKKKKVISL